jgi:hypothetical protein
MVVFPDEANSPLIVDSDRMLSAPFGFQCLESVTGRHAEVFESLGYVQETQFAKRSILNV